MAVQSTPYYCSREFCGDVSAASYINFPENIFFRQHVCIYHALEMYIWYKKDRRKLPKFKRTKK